MTVREPGSQAPKEKGRLAAALLLPPSEALVPAVLEPRLVTLGEGRVVVYTEPGDTKATGELISTALGLDISSSEIISDANEETLVTLDDGEATQELAKFADAIQDKESGVHGIYMNVKEGPLDHGVFAELQSRITA